MITWDSLLRHHPLNELSTFRIGGLATYYAPASSIEEMRGLILFAQEHSLPWIVIGKGSNTLFADEGFLGLVIVNKIDHIIRHGGVWKVGAGYSFSLLGKQSAKAGYKGLEFACGIPASVGGAVFMNAGANGSETAAALYEVLFLSPDGQLQTFKKEELAFAYRHSLFQEMPGAIVEATFHLMPCSLARSRQEEILSYRMKTQPYEYPSIGCIFRNEPGYCAGALIEEAGLKGRSVGGAAVSTKHANFIVNRGKATAGDVNALIEIIKNEVESHCGVILKEEVRRLPLF